MQILQLQKLNIYQCDIENYQLRVKAEGGFNHLFFFFLSLYRKGSLML